MYGCICEDYNVIYNMVADDWEDIPPTTLCKSWNKILKSVSAPSSETDSPDDSFTESCEELLQ